MANTAVLIDPTTGLELALKGAAGGATTAGAVGAQSNCGTTAGAVTVTAPAPSDEGNVFAVFDADGNAINNPITVDGNGVLIDGAATVTLSIAGGYACFMFDRSQWRRIAPRRRAPNGAIVELVADLPAGGLNITSFGTSLVSSANAAGARSTLGLGTAAVQPSSAFDAAGAATAAYNSAVAQIGWRTALDLDFTAEASQSLAANGNYTIGGLTWKRENAAQDRVAMALTNGTGLVIKSAASVYDGATRTAPLVWLALSQLGISLDYSTKFRIWLRATDGYNAGFFNAGDNFFFGLDNDSVTWTPFVFRSAPVGGIATRRFTALAGTSGVQRLATAGPDQATGTVFNIGRLDTDELGMPGRISQWWDQSSGAWPAVDAATLHPVNAISAMPNTLATDYPNAVNPAGAVGLGANLGIVLGACNGAAGDKYELTITNLRVDYKS